MKSRYTNLFRIFFSFMDLCALNIVHLVLLFFLDPGPDKLDYPYILLFGAMNLIWLGSAYLTALYINDRQLDFEGFAKRTVQAFLIFLVVVLLFIFLYKFNYSRMFIVGSFIGFASTLTLNRFFFILGARYFTGSEKFVKRILILGYNDVGKKLASHFTNNSKNITIEGYFEDHKNIRELSLYPVIGDFDECLKYAVNNKISEIYCTVAPERNKTIYDLAQIAEKNMIRFKFVPDFRFFVNRAIHFDFIEDIPILSLRQEPLQDMAGRIKKRLFDIVFSMMVSIFLLSWLIPLMAILIKLDSRGPVFFVQLRSGINNRPFRCFKFRSLKLNNESDTKQVTQNDNRFTRLGKFLRKTNLDEMPQFLNGMMGDMSIVGPRPHMLKHTDEYSQLIGEYMVRQFLKPGITGWAQVNGYRGETKQVYLMHKRVEHDLWYMEHWSLWLDIRIIFMTIVNAIKGEKNAF